MVRALATLGWAQRPQTGGAGAAAEAWGRGGVCGQAPGIPFLPYLQTKWPVP